MEHQPAPQSVDNALRWHSEISGSVSSHRSTILGALVSGKVSPPRFLELQRRRSVNISLSGPTFKKLWLPYQLFPELTLLITVANASAKHTNTILDELLAALQDN